MAVVVSAMSGETNRLVALVKSVNPDAPAKAYDMEQWEPDEVRASGAVLREARGEIPLAYSPFSTRRQLRSTRSS